MPRVPSTHQRLLSKLKGLSSHGRVTESPGLLVDNICREGGEKVSRARRAIGSLVQGLHGERCILYQYRWEFCEHHLINNTVAYNRFVKRLKRSLPGVEIQLSLKCLTSSLAKTCELNLFRLKLAGHREKPQWFDNRPASSLAKCAPCCLLQR